LTGDGNYGSGETNEFCATFVCMLGADIDISPANVATGNDGSILITPLNGVGPYQYSIDGGTNFQSSNLFTDLMPGDYNIVITGTQECFFETSVNLGTCTLELLAQANNPTSSTSNDGTIVLTTVGGIPPYQYSIDGGQTLQASTIFGGLGPDTYEAYVIDGNGCVSRQTIVLDFQTSTTNFVVGQSIEVFPNPTEGVFRINISGLERNDVFLQLEIFDAQGKMVQTSQLVKYDGVYTAQVSLMAYSQGVYFVRFLDEKINRLVRIVKQ
ncbi:MAG: T9SS type A sorting domain-containing protein, partial [Bacteroidota bacterium]